MPELIPFAVIHIGVGVALAAILILVYKRVHRADFLLYWAMFWLAIAANLAASRAIGPLFATGTAGRYACGTFAVSLLPFHPVLMICAALSLGKGLSKRAARAWLAGAAVLTLLIWAYAYLTPHASRMLQSLAVARPIFTAAAVAFFAYRLAVAGHREAGSTRPALIGLSLLYCLHNLALGWSPFGWHIYPPGGYAPWSAAVGILLQFGLTLVIAYSAIDRAGEALREARESDRRLRSLLESVGIAGLIVDHEGRVEFCNRWLVEALEQPAEAIVGSLWFECYVPESEQRQVRQVFESGIKTGQWPAIFEYPILAGGDREVAVQWYHTSLRNTEGAIIGAASLGLDMSQQRLLEEQIRQGQKMETLGQLAGGVAHDFNNNLTVINGAADLLLRHFPPGDPLHRQVQDIRDSGEFATTLTRQLMTFSRKRKGDPQPVSLNETVRNAESMLRRLVREDITLEIETAPDLGYTLADPGQLDQIVLNLVVNAIDAITGPGRIRLSTGEVTRDDGRSLRRFVVLAVGDNGCGMNERTRLRLFEPFFTTKAEGKGTGLGLATVHGAVTQAGGWVDVASRPGEGSTFSVYLPLVEAPARIEPAPAMPSAPDKPGTILLVEDQEMVRRFACAVLEEQGYCVVEASSGVDALRIAADPSLDIALLVTDVIMPQMSGEELAQRLEKSRPGLRTLFVSGYAFDRNLGAGRPAETRAFLQKPYTPEQLCNQVVKLAAKAKSRSTLP